jgi:flagellar hook assembly protein FlgD
MIVDEQGGTIFSPLTTQMIVNVEPAGKKKWCWDQRRNDGQRVEPGMYVIKMNAYIENEKQGFSKRIEIGR